MLSSSAPAIELRDVVKSFTSPGAGTVTAVDGLDLTVRPGEVVAFLGPNGAGKTTTLDMVLGLTDPTSGSVSVYGEPPRRAVMGGRVSAVLQTGGLLRDLSVRETVQMIASTFATHAGVDAVMGRADLLGIAGRKVSKCSGGEQQRLRYALALLPDPDLIILDEPTAGMDVSSRAGFWETMHADAAAGRTVVFATHYLEEADAFAQRIVMVAGGRVVADGSTHEIRAQASGRVVTADLDDPDRVLPRLRALPEVIDAEADGTRVTVHAGDSDAVARALLTELGGRNLEISSGSLESAFLQITAPRSAEETR
ncbi:ABC transporter, ATP-binding protein [Aeromicrobium marinum DSM 15272]|uniref:ABC transporter, ATP-binding protein n=1 Tax=Aeromicrobium marinum DSM 15272 TaxID=585531 RepID=E2S8K1_9ACTN|nr:ABC transporter ATP-binding protein [Aeromicrobium marinum]EFQ84506.1 ABC transporter, ATP-binding protein [Aeromicrobium marinum DSM 15272]